MSTPARAADKDDHPTPLTAPALNTFLQTLFKPVRDSQKDWLTRLDLTFDKLDLEHSLLAFHGGAGVANSAWSTKPSALDFSADFSVVADRYTSDLNHATIHLSANLSTETLALARYVGERNLCPAAAAQESDVDRDYRLAQCAFAERLRKVSTVRDLGGAFLESVEDLTAQLSDYERDLLSTWAVVPEVSDRNGAETFHVSAKASGTKSMAGAVEAFVKADGVTLKADLVVDINDATNQKIAGVAWTYLGGLLDADSRQLATMQKALSDYAKSLRPKGANQP